jgi:hypothetical protein
MAIYANADEGDLIVLFSDLS